MGQDMAENLIQNVTSRGLPPAHQLAIATPLPRDVKVSFEFFLPPCTKQRCRIVLGLR